MRETQVTFSFTTFLVKEVTFNNLKLKLSANIEMKYCNVREGFKIKTANYPHFVDKGGGHQMWIKKFLNVNIINFENVDKPEGGGVGQCG